MSKARERMIGIAAASFAGIAGAALVSYFTVHLTASLIIGIVAAVVAVLIIGATAYVTRRSSKPPTAPID